MDKETAHHLIAIAISISLIGLAALIPVMPDVGKAILTAFGLTN